MMRDVTATRAEVDLLGTHLIAANVASERLRGAFEMWCRSHGVDPRAQLIAINDDVVTVRVVEGQADGAG